MARALTEYASKGSIQLFEDWAFGNVYGYEVLDANGENIDSCWGFFGDYDTPYSALSEAKSAADGHIRHTTARID